jgi:competence protein ComEA
MSPRNAEAGVPAAASRARRRLTATLGQGSGGGHETEPGALTSAPGLLEHGAGAPGGRPFNYNGGAQGDSGGGASPATGGKSAPAKFRWRTGLRVAVLVGLLCLLLGGWYWWDVAASSPGVTPLSDVSSPEGSAQPDGGAAAASAGRPRSTWRWTGCGRHTRCENRGACRGRRQQGRRGGTATGKPRP